MKRKIADNFAKINQSLLQILMSMRQEYTAHGLALNLSIVSAKQQQKRIRQLVIKANAADI